MLEHLLLSPEEAETMKLTLVQQVKVLTALEESAFQKRTASMTQLETLSHQVEELNAKRQKLAVRPPRHFNVCLSACFLSAVASHLPMLHYRILHRC